MIGLVSSIFGQHLSFYSVHPICNILGAQDAHLETLTLTLALNKVWNRLHQPTQNLDLEFFLVDLFNYGFGFEFSFYRLGLGFSLGVVNLEELDLFFRTDLNLISTGPFFGKYEFGVPVRFLLFEYEKYGC
ncbi:hypothetical protein GLOIN_2v1886488 [Rhizophagus irregularis DAOM 181602=DAOM 197198]|nr:hypothetical protein GLOIN_2v1886488 [Rhizophagus irregularis DAOM 181602=DAOM 197198]